MKQALTALIVIVCIIAGGFAGHLLKVGPGAVSGASAAATADTAVNEEEAETQAPEKAAPAPSGDVIFYKFSREFVVPILKDGHVVSLVLLHINLEADASISDKLFSMEPKLRDNIMTTLVQLSNDGETFETITNVDSYESLRKMILMNLENVVAEGIYNVLILDMAKQNL